MKLLSTVLHHAGSQAGKENAEFIAELLESWGYEVEIVEYQVVLADSKIREIEMLSPTQYTAS